VCGFGRRAAAIGRLDVGPRGAATRDFNSNELLQTASTSFVVSDYNERQHRRQNDTVCLPSIISERGIGGCGSVTVRASTRATCSCIRMLGLLLERPSSGREPGGRKSPNAGNPLGGGRSVGRSAAPAWSACQRPSTCDRTPVRHWSQTSVRCDGDGPPSSSSIVGTVAQPSVELSLWRCGTGARVIGRHASGRAGPFDPAD